ncbi:IS4 family transposase [Noviherbaspirillum sedimenti]|uniref:IS4 family transposase n=1 Tax=Noviherbaspirillum sedimenti TaxID=2320865 RepID=A0A3A3GNL4_9BURK|nr:IS4 family transposase [Noviherbaspirillum sedimenti]RJG03906.1 IS4 family transposase [Noviherbaspirillum sedimenti]
MQAAELQDDADWAENELGLVQLGDKRLTARLVSLARVLARAPDASLPAAMPAWSDLKAAYRFFDNAKAVPEHILAGHIDATWSRARQVPIVLAIQDTTCFDWTHHPATQGLGPMSPQWARGLFCHSTLAVTPERLPLGLLAQRNWVRDDRTFAALAPHRKRPVTDKESSKWLDSVKALAAAREAAPHTMFVSVGDREDDVIDLFAMERPAGVELLIRATRNRVVEGEHGHLWNTVLAPPILGRIEVAVPRRPGCAARRCTLALRSTPIVMRPPKQRRKELGDIGMWAVLATEETPPSGAQAIEWMLLTTVAAPTMELAAQRVSWYTCRWSIEVWHRVLKTGCRIEARQLETVERLEVAMTLYGIIAWRILYATMRTRLDAELPCTVLLTNEEWQALYCRVKQVA